MIDYRENIIHAATAELGSEDWARYVQAEVPGCGKVSWCGIFWLWCLHQAGVALDLEWQLGKGVRPTPRRISVLEAKPGDGLYMHKNQHYGVFVRWEYEGDDVFVVSIDGNSTGGRVTERRRLAAEWVCAFSVRDEIAKLEGVSNSPAYASSRTGNRLESNPALPIPSPTSVVRVPHPEWKERQRKLRDAGLYTGDIDGDPGPKTCQAIIREWMGTIPYCG